MSLNKTKQKIYSAYLELCATHALSCTKCDSLSFPLLGTTNRYRCSNCGRQFAAAKHDCTYVGYSEAKLILSKLTKKEYTEIFPPPPKVGVLKKMAGYSLYCIVRVIFWGEETTDGRREKVEEIVYTMQKQKTQA
jgi:hypothetical protein